MTDPSFDLHASVDVLDRASDTRPLGRHLVEAGKITPTDLVQALDRQKDIAAALGEILVADGTVTEADVLDSVARQHALAQVDLATHAPDRALARTVPREVWLNSGCLPWRKTDGAVFLATARPDRLDALHRDLPSSFAPVVPVVAAEDQIARATEETFRHELTIAAETRVAPEFSCRHWRGWQVQNVVSAAVVLAGLIYCAVFWPNHTFSILCGIAVLLLSLITGLKLIAVFTHIGRKVHEVPSPPQLTGQLPRISMLVPLFKEKEIASALVTRLQKITYPKVLMDVILVLEEKDSITRQTLEACELPPWMRVIVVPDGGGITTKPRALNYALDFCRGDIVGIWDAEDAPTPDQLHQVAAYFDTAPKDVVCVQGILDYYNPRANWIARCFTLEYASWFRVILPGMARLGLVIPLGGTTMFIKRDKLLELGGWDAHNVTEDADLGVRIARMGYRTQFVATPTYEEANCRPWRWTKQRSRWLKGFMVTYVVHMRRPRKLLRELGWARFLGMNAYFVGTLSQFLFAPVLWSFWLKMLALPHPSQSVFEAGFLAIVAGLFVLSQLVNIGIAMLAVWREEARFLLPWSLTLPFYFPLGALASYKALYELLANPFYWDKTQHGHSSSETGV